jgi:hypothetical protein
MYRANRKNFLKATVATALLTTAALSAQNASALDFGLQDLRLEAINASNTTGASTSALVTWLPSVSVMDKLDVKGNVGYTMYRGTDTKLNAVGNLGLLASYRIIDPIAVEVGAGTQIYQAAGGSLMLNANAMWIPSDPILGRINKVVAGYTRINRTIPMNEVHVGVEISLGTILSGKAETPAAAK